MNEKAGNDRGLSDALGAVVLISVVALGISVAAVSILSGPLPQKLPALNAEVFNTSDTVYIRHAGGDTLIKGEYRILADGQDRTSAFLMGGAVPARWSVGDTLEYHIPAGDEIPASIQVVAITGTSEQMILQVQIRPPTLVPTHTTLPTVSVTTGTITTSTTTSSTTTTASTTTSTTTSSTMTTTTTTTTSSIKTVTVSWHPNGLGSATLSPSTPLSNGQAVSVPTGSSPTFIFTPDSNKAVQTIWLDGAVVYSGSSKGTPVSYTIPNIIASPTLEAEFG
jgi:hypothetical protein